MMKRLAVVGAFAVASLVMPAYGLAQHEHGQAGKTAQKAQKAEAKGEASDVAFAKKAAGGGLFEVEAGKMAAEKAASEDVKKYGQMMVDDHSKANQQLQKVASQKNITLPTEMAAKEKATRDRLEKLSGAAFDRAYMATMVQDHAKDVAEFRKEAKSGSDPDIKKFAEETLPTLEHHLDEAKKVNANLKGAGKAAPAKKGKKN